MPVGSAATPAPARYASRSVLRLVISIIVLVALLAAIAAAFAALNRQFWSASAFAERYVQKVAGGDASGALAMPGVSPDLAQLEATGYADASEALLRSSALTSDIANIRATAERETADGVHEVDVEYTIDDEPGGMTLAVERTGWSGLVPAWSFTTSPLAILDVKVRGSWRFSVNGFEMDKRQISGNGFEADPLDPIPMLAFAPSGYEIAVNTAATTSDPELLRAEEPLGTVPVDVQTEPTAELSKLVQEGVEQHFDEVCTTQARLKPEDCPFDYDGTWGIAQPDIEWSVKQYPQTALVPDGDSWRISPTAGIMHLGVTMVHYDGPVERVEEDVHFTMDGTVVVHDGGSVEIVINRAEGF